MIVTVNVQEFLRELELLAKVVAPKPTIPVLGNCLVQAEGTGLRLAATDLEIGLVTFCPATVTVPGVTTLPVKHMLDVVRLLTHELIITLDKTSVKLSSGQYNGRFQTYGPQDYPAMPSMKDLPTVTLPGNLQTMIQRVRFAVSDKNKRYYMDGAQMTGTSLAATDGHRLAYAACPDSGLTEVVIIPSKTLDKLVEMVNAETLFAVGVQHLFFVTDGRMLFSRMVAGEFPKYERIIPKETDRLVTFGRQALQQALQRVVLTSTEVVCKFTPGVLTLTGRSAEIGDAVEQVDITYDGPETSISLSGAYLLDFLNVASGQTITWAWKGAGTLLFTDGTDYRFVLMPLRAA